MATSKVFGIDGCRAGWMVASTGGEEYSPSFRVVRTFAEAANTVMNCEGLACIDIPIGLQARPRRCDVEARRLLGSPRASSVFTPPSREALAGRTPADIRDLNLRATGRSLSEQALGIVPKIREVDEVISPEMQTRIREVHPEVIFAGLCSPTRGLASSKKTPEGREDRLRLLPAGWAHAIAEARFARADAGIDDLVDAAAALLVAIRMAKGTVRTLPGGPHERDLRGLRMEMLY